MTTSAPATTPADERAAERWYLRIDGTRYGPVGRAELEKFLAPPRLCSVLEVKCGDDGDWCYINRSETIDKVLIRFGVDPGPVVESAVVEQTAARSGTTFLGSSRDFFEGLAAWLGYHWVGVTVAITIVTVNVAILSLLHDPHSREREITARYTAIWQKIGEFNAETPADEWRKFAAPAATEVDAITRELEDTASVHRPGQQNLLFAGRDHLKRILQADRPPKLRDPQRNLFDRRLQAAQAQYSRTASGQTQTGKAGAAGARSR